MHWLPLLASAVYSRERPSLCVAIFDHSGQGLDCLPFLERNTTFPALRRVRLSASSPEQQQLNVSLINVEDHSLAVSATVAFDAPASNGDVHSVDLALNINTGGHATLSIGDSERSMPNVFHFKSAFHLSAAAFYFSVPAEAEIVSKVAMQAEITKLQGGAENEALLTTRLAAAMAKAVAATTAHDVMIATKSDLEQQLEAAQEEAVAAQSELAALRTTAAHGNSLLGDAKKTIAAATAAAVTATTSAEEATARAVAAEEAKVAMEAAIAMLRSAAAEEATKSAAASADLDEARSTVDALQSEVAALKDAQAKQIATYEQCRIDTAAALDAANATAAEQLDEAMRAATLTLRSSLAELGEMHNATVAALTAEQAVVAATLASAESQIEKHVEQIAELHLNVTAAAERSNAEAGQQMAALRVDLTVEAARCAELEAERLEESSAAMAVAEQRETAAVKRELAKAAEVHAANLAALVVAHEETLAAEREVEVERAVRAAAAAQEQLESTRDFAEMELLRLAEEHGEALGALNVSHHVAEEHLRSRVTEMRGRLEACDEAAVAVSERLAACVRLEKDARVPAAALSTSRVSTAALHESSTTRTSLEAQLDALRMQQGCPTRSPSSSVLSSRAGVPPALVASSAAAFLCEPQSLAVLTAFLATSFCLLVAGIVAARAREERNVSLARAQARDKASLARELKHAVFLTEADASSATRSAETALCSQRYAEEIATATLDELLRHADALEEALRDDEVQVSDVPAKVESLAAAAVVEVECRSNEERTPTRGCTRRESIQTPTKLLERMLIF